MYSIAGSYACDNGHTAGQQLFSWTMITLLRMQIAAAYYSAYPPQTTWLTPTAEPGRSEFYHHKTAAGAMPIGNGDTTALVWPALDEGAIMVQVAKQDAMGNDMALMKLGTVKLIVAGLNGSQANQPGFNQTLDLATGTVTIKSSGIMVEIFVDALASAIRAKIMTTRGSSHHSVPLVVELSSVRPTRTGAEAWDTGGGLNNCTYCTGTTYFRPPDTFDIDGPVVGTNASSKVLPPVLLLSHSNPTNFSIVQAVLTQQGLGNLRGGRLEEEMEDWAGRTFGLSVSGHGLNRLKTSLVSSADAMMHEVVISTLTTVAPRETWKARIRRVHTTNSMTPYATARRGHNNWWTQFWGRSHVIVGAGSNASQAQEAAQLTTQYANARYLQSIQSRGRYPIKFNGQLFVNHLPPFADFREWGADEWWQNTRLPYMNMLAAGDADCFTVILEYYWRMIPFARARTMAYFRHPGVFWTETKTLFGAYSPRGWGCPRYGQPGHQNFTQKNFSSFHCYRPLDYPAGYEMSNNTHLDFHGGGQVAIMVLDHYLYTANKTALRRYLPLATGVVEFFWHHYPKRTAEGHRFQIWPAQALEAYWCPLPVRPEECSVDDAPTLASLHAILPRLLDLPTAFTTKPDRLFWKTFLDMLPPLPTKPCPLRTNMTGENQPACSSPGRTILAPCRTCSKLTDLQETPELYSVHPFQIITAGRAALDKSVQTRNQLELAVASYHAAPLAHFNASNPFVSNIGWQQGIINAALLGLANDAMAMALQRAFLPPAPGARWQGFAQHLQDSDPSADHFANMNSAVNLMLIQPAHDGLINGSIVLLPSWPCEWSVAFKLQGPLRTTIELSWDGATKKLVKLEVLPPHRKSVVHFARCVKM